jgi:hypothetical protein
MTSSFTIVNAHIITSTSAFTAGDTTVVLGRPGQKFRTLFYGHKNASPPPDAHLAGYAVGVVPIR